MKNSVPKDQAHLDSQFADLLNLAVDRIGCRSARIMLLREGRLATRWATGAVDLIPTAFWQKVLSSGEAAESGDENHAFFGVPILERDGSALGVFSVHGTGVCRFSPEHQELVRKYANIATGLLRTESASSGVDKKIATEMSLLAEAMPQMVWTVNNEGYTIFSNTRWAKHLVHTEKGLILDQSLIHPEDIGRVWSVWDDSRATGSLYECEFRLKCGGTEDYRWLLVRAAPVHNENGVIDRWYATGTDIQEQKRIESELRSVEQRMKAILANAPIVVFTINMDGIFTYSEGSARDGIANGRPSSIGQSIFDLYQHAPRCLEGVRRSLKGESDTHEGYLGENYYQTVTSPLFDGSGKQVGVIGLIHDLTPMKLSEKAQSASAAREAAALESARLKGEFLANMSHEIRTPLNRIIGMAEILQQTPLNTEQREFLKVLLDSSEVLIGLINDVLDMSKIEAGEVELCNHSTDVNRLIATTWGTHEMHAAQKGIDLRLNLDPKTPPFVSVDSLRLQQILNNLISNAIKFTEKGVVEVDAQWISYGALRISVRDTGIGIETETQERLFRNFTQGDASITKRYGGTGLGLAISKKLVELMKGKIGMMSVVGEGSEFWFEIPCKVGETEVFDAAADPQVVSNDLAPVVKKRILLVEDNDINRRVVASYLPGLSFDVEIAVNGAQAYEKCQEKSYDLILMDCQMPVMGGLEAARLIRNLESLSGGHTPIVAITANAMAGDREQCLEAGMDDYLAKPLKKKVLLETIDRLVKKT